ncbi:ribonuclease H-like domain-containing protein, partial [Tanacetum coccineum]
CDGATKLKDHKDLMRLMQFLMGLDNTYNVVMSQILTTKPLCFKLNGYPLGFKKRNSKGTNVSNNASSYAVKSDQSAGTPSPFTADHINRIIALIESKSDFGKLQSCAAGATQHMIFSTGHLYDVIDVSHLKITVSHPNGTFEDSLLKSLSGTETIGRVIVMASENHLTVLMYPLIFHPQLPVNQSDGVVNQSPNRINNSNSDDLGSSGASPKIGDATLYDDEYESEDLPKGRKAIGSKWIFKVKYKSSVEVERFKARCLLIVAVSNKWPIYQLDINNAFLYVYVDFIIITGNNEIEINNFKKYLSSKFKIKDLGKLKYFLGIEVLETDNGLCLNHGSYCTKLLSEYGMLACKPAKAPIPD